MKKYAIGLFAIAVLFAPIAQGADSFRLENGQLLQNGMTKGEVLDKAGKPKMKDIIRRAGINAEKKEVWTFFVNDTFGTQSIVSVTFEGNSVIKVEAKAKAKQ